MTRPRVICSRKWPASVEAKLQARFGATLNHTDVALTADQLRDALDNFDAVCPTVTDNVDAAVLAAPKRARILGQFGVGFNNIDLEAAKTAGLVVTNTPGVLTDAITETRIAMGMTVVENLTAFFYGREPPTRVA